MGGAGRARLDGGPAVRTRPPWQVVASLLIAVLAVGVAAVSGARARTTSVADTGPLAVATVGQPGADSAACRNLMPRLPAKLTGAQRRAIRGGGNSVVAWGDPAVILRCGIETPEELTCSAELLQVNGVSWLQLTSAGESSTTYLAADRSVRIALTVPNDRGTGPVQEISDTVAATLPVRAPCSAGVLLPTDVH